MYKWEHTSRWVWPNGLTHKIGCMTMPQSCTLLRAPGGCCAAPGLDSFAALNVMEHMSSLANLGHTVIASIHQPRSAIWDMFDKVRERMQPTS